MNVVFGMGILLAVLTSCNSCPEKVPPYTQQEFTGREERTQQQRLVRRPTYRAKVPIGWKRIDPENPIQDTREANVTFRTEDGIVITVHTFPTETLEERVPPAAQVARWKGQLKDAPSAVHAISQAGFAGLKLDAPTLLAWSMQLDFEHYQTLSFLAQSIEEEEHYKQMRADYTIKATGTEAALDLHRKELELFASSFELIQEIPKRT